jgi:hypothetical protein
VLELFGAELLALWLWFLLSLVMLVLHQREAIGVAAVNVAAVDVEAV